MILKHNETISSENPNTYIDGGGASSSKMRSINMQSKYDSCFVSMLTAVGSIGGFLFGYDTGIIAGA